MKTAAIAALFVALCAPAYAHDERRPPAASVFGGIVHEGDIGLVFDYLREALDAAVAGREAPPPDDVARRANEIGDEMKRRGAAAARVFIDVIEETVREALSEPPPRPALPPSSHYQRI